jgi:hypothetical protein
MTGGTPCATSPAEEREPPGAADDPCTSPDPPTAAVCAAATDPTAGGTSGTDAARLVVSDSGLAGAAPRSDDAARLLVPWHLPAVDGRFHGATARLDAELCTEKFKVRKRNETLSLKKMQARLPWYQRPRPFGRTATRPLGVGHQRALVARLIIS